MADASTPSLKQSAPGKGLPESSVKIAASSQMIDGSNNNIEHNPETKTVRSSRTSNSMNSAYPHAIEVSEEVKTKLYEMRWCFVAIVCNILLFVLTYFLMIGIQVPFSPAVATSVAVVVFELILIISNFITNSALDSGAAAYLGYLYASRKGYSLAACGFMQANNFIDKALFSTYLSLNSTCRQLLARASNLWVLLNLVLILVPISAAAAHASAFRMNFGTVPCLIFNEDGIPYDREWPTVMVEKGISEVIFGTSLGVPRSEFPVDASETLIAPQIVGAVQDGDTLIGPGYQIKILTSCTCAPSSDAAGLRVAKVPSAQVTPLLNAISGMTNRLGMANYITEASDDDFHITSILTGTFVCGGRNSTNPDIPVCTTRFFNYTTAEILVTFMTDGTPASIAPKKAEVVKLGSKANITWAHAAMTAILEGQVSAYTLPSIVPGVVNPMLYWTTPNLISIDPTLIEAGIETKFMILLRAGAQRSYNTKGITCGRNVEVAGNALIDLKSFGIVSAFLAASIQLAISLFAAACYIPWLLSKDPLGPAVRMTKDKAYFTTLVHSSTLFNPDTLCNAAPHVIWQALDQVIRVGETFRSRDEEIVGHITIDRPKQIAALTNGRKYN